MLESRNVAHSHTYLMMFSTVKVHEHRCCCFHTSHSLSVYEGSLTMHSGSSALCVLSDMAWRCPLLISIKFNSCHCMQIDGVSPDVTPLEAPKALLKYFEAGKRWKRCVASRRYLQASSTIKRQE